MTVNPLSWADPDPVAPALRLVPDLPLPPDPLGADVLPPEASLDQEVLVRRVVPLTHDVVQVVLEPTRPGGVAFTPGQYLTLGVEVDGRHVERCYTISSPPTRPHLLSLTVKRVPDGEVSTYLHDRVRPGDRLQVTGPLGGFSVAEHPSRRYLLLSAGSGVTPTLATLRTMADLAELEATGSALDVVVVHSARTPDDLVARAEVEALAATHPGLRVHWVCETDGAPDRSGPWSGPRGRLTADLLRAFAPDVADREVFTCGPPGYMAAARLLLAEVGADPARCHEESFVLGTAGAPAAAAAAAAAAAQGAAEGAAPAASSRADAAGTEGEVEGHLLAAPAPSAPAPVATSVTFARSGCEVACPAGTTVLAAAEQAGVRLPSSCAEGMCGTCKSTLLSGRVEMKHAGGIRPREIAQDKFLPCCSTPDGDIVVDA
ncbi:hybrid-cluster NAD(P)-dependent oxidoreductase [Nocardioides sp. HDW12B]|uniref:hybrid-cluster NAD(P)-dependent oxidoreductase n=1 Tax=Nocardioides sp. HDW12B TaxID=2714939 RepID=UPI001409B1AA|nr:hybrid-cluster NAD(P)-dependent oxidoreductase [Nocardioides sp. HDW12B]QIK67970.1 hybrid-cluster NAD(P)-dependent oxidoreductase [Nocardioides sp. HDW12B]